MGLDRRSAFTSATCFPGWPRTGWCSCPPTSSRMCSRCAPACWCSTRGSCARRHAGGLIRAAEGPVGTFEARAGSREDSLHHRPGRHRPGRHGLSGSGGTPLCPARRAHPGGRLPLSHLRGGRARTSRSLNAGAFAAAAGPAHLAGRRPHVLSPLAGLTVYRSRLGRHDAVPSMWPIPPGRGVLGRLLFALLTLCDCARTSRCRVEALCDAAVSPRPLPGKADGPAEDGGADPGPHPSGLASLDGPYRGRRL